MKTAEEWVKESYGPGGKHASEQDLIRAVQADALFSVSRYIYHRTGEMMSMMKRPNCSEIAHEIEQMAKNIRDNANA